MKLVRSVLLAAAACYECAAADFTITSTAAAAPEQALGEHEPYAATWTVAGEAPLAALHVRTLGRVFVDFDASLAAADNTTLAKVVISGNDTRLLNAFEVVSVEHDDAAVELHMANTEFEGQGYLLTRVYVAHAQALGSLSVAWGSDTVVGDDVLVTANATGALALSLAGSGDVYLGSAGASWSVGSLAASVAGSGNIQLLAKSLAADDVSINVAGSGDVAVVADAVKVQKSLSTVVAGSGDAKVQAGDLQVHNLSTAIAGSGDVTYSKKGACQQQSIALAGSGDVAAGSIVCENTDVSLVGSGDVLVQTTGNLTVSSIFGSEVRYFGAEPRSISVSGLFSFRGSHKNTKKIVKEAKRNDYVEVDVESPPKAAPVYVVVKTSSSFFSDEPKIRYDLEIDEYDAQVVDEFLASQDGTVRADYTSASVNNFAMVPASAHVAGGPAVFAIVGAALVAVGVAATKYQRRRERQQYQPLV